MTTDGGGYILIGRMNDTVTWDVPSTNTTVQPFGGTQWSSAFGDVPILDFRIQVAIDGLLHKEIKAHWYFSILFFTIHLMKIDKLFSALLAKYGLE